MSRTLCLQRVMYVGIKLSRPTFVYFVITFEVRKSVHHHTIQINQPIRCNSFTSLLLDFMCGSTCFGRFHAHHQELITALTASCFTSERGGSSVVCRGLAVQQRQLRLSFNELTNAKNLVRHSSHFTLN